MAHFLHFSYRELMDEIPVRDLYRLHAEAVKLHNHLTG